MKANKITSHICIGIAIATFIIMCILSNQTNLKLYYDAVLAIFGSALLSSVVAYLAYKNQLREAKIDLFTELLSGYGAYARFFDYYSGGTLDISKVHSEAYGSLDRFFSKHSLYSALLGNNVVILDQLAQAAKSLNTLNGEVILLTKFSPSDREFYHQHKIVKETLSVLESNLISIGAEIISKSFGITSTYNMDI
ncbi:hypothetical protein NE686_03690 [Tissierella carlieri]|uniref:Uncharacterized protein n=1 Tax=Tissierella carlieri TaxID=689904 RepID=A0ABT1S825_9FIRM|nr:hypothetical protein [Tissierella carlieri]MCQ4922172.1 hypothetical protein [Tissierella carlieri]